MSLRIMVIALMLLTAAALGTIAYQLATPARVAPAPTAALPPPLAVGYLVAARTLPAGTLARDDDFNVKRAESGQIPSGAFTDSPEARASLRGALIRAYLETGAPITADDILRPRDRGFIASVLAPGMRAVSIGVDPVTGVAGLIWPGDHVDVILTQDMAEAPVARRVLSETVLSNIRVIGIDQAIVQGAPSNAAVAGHLARTVTLEVAPNQAELLAVADHLGKLSLAIRAAEDAQGPVVAAKPTVFGVDVSPALSNANEPVGVTVHLVQGGNRSEVTFK